MEIFNIHIFEFLLIAALALVIFGPERLPEVGRFIGKQVARFLAWQQQSPELRVINDVRAEFEREIASLRDELLRTRNQLDLSREVETVREELSPMLDLKLSGAGQSPAAAASPAPALAPSGETPAASPTGAGDAAPAPTPSGDTLAATVSAPPSAGEAAPAGPADAPGATELPLPEPTAELATPELAPLTPQPATRTVPAAARPNRIAGTEPSSVFTPVDERARELAERRARLHDPPADDEPPVRNGVGSVAEPVAPPASLADEEHERIVSQIQALSTQLQQLVSELRERGVLRAEWSLARPPEEETVSR